MNPLKRERLDLVQNLIQKMTFLHLFLAQIALFCPAALRLSARSAGALRVRGGSSCSHKSSLPDRYTLIIKRLSILGGSLQP